MILEPKKIKSVTLSIVSPSICHEVMLTEFFKLFFIVVKVKNIKHTILIIFNGVLWFMGSKESDMTERLN